MKLSGRLAQTTVRIITIGARLSSGLCPRPTSRLIRRCSKLIPREICNGANSKLTSRLGQLLRYAVISSRQPVLTPQIARLSLNSISNRCQRFNKAWQTTSQNSWLIGSRTDGTLHKKRHQPRKDRTKMRESTHPTNNTCNNRRGP